MSAEASGLVVRRAVEDDLDAIARMVEDFVRGHPAERHPRARERLRDAYFGPAPVARIFVAVRRGAVVGMCQWAPVFDMFWSMRGGRAEWLYVEPAARGHGIALAIIAAICDDVRRSGGELIYGGYGEALAPLYERVVEGWANRECALSAEAFQVLADLAGRPPKDIVRGIPAPALNRVPARPRP